MALRVALIFVNLLLLTACGGTAPLPGEAFSPSPQHIQLPELHPTGKIPEISTTPISLPPRHSRKKEKYSVIVSNVPVQEILFALARDAQINLDIHPAVQGNITINAIDQTLPQILERITKLIDIRYELADNNLLIVPDTPYLETYPIDYVYMNRDLDESISNASQLTSIQNGGSPNSNNSSISLKSTSKNHFWEHLEANIKDILRETDKILPEGSSETITQQSSNTHTTGTGVAPPGNSRKQVVIKGGIENSPNAAAISGEGTTITRQNTFREAASVIINPETGIVSVRATRKQHQKIQELISHILSSAHRQVLIEATIVEVRLNRQYQQGINWASLNAYGSNSLNINQVGAGSLTAANSGSIFTLAYSDSNSGIGNLNASIKLMESFGKVKVLSSPKLSVMNNQTAILRVVDNYVYFTISATTVSSTGGAPAVTTYSTTSNSVPVGFTMSVTPQISDNDTVLLNMRPSITRLFGFINDPNPDLAKAGVVSQIPQTQTREMESVIQLTNNQIAVMGGLIQDELNYQSDETPWLGRIPIIGGLFKYRNDKNIKSELVILLKPLVIKTPGFIGDYQPYHNKLSNQDSLKDKNIVD